MRRRQALALVVVGLALITASLFITSLPLAAQEEPVEDPLGEPPTFLTGYYEAWVNSPHADVDAEAFRHWDEDGEISERCATCHSTPGYLDFVGADGTEAGVVDAPAPLGSVVNCDACHNSATASLTSVTFPSGVEIGNLGDSSRCMICHQGRASGLTVDNSIEELGLSDSPNEVSEELGFINIHYYAAAASLYGSAVHGGYEFEGMRYHGRTVHVEGVNTCASCHDPHTLELGIAQCADCHEGVETVEDIRAIRSVGSLVDYDGDADIEEGILGEIETLQAMLYDTMLAYSAEVVGTPIGYGGGYPYFFVDTDGDGVISEEEGAGDNAYSAFTPVLLQAAYNYQVTLADPGGYAHNPDYHIQLLVDSIMALNEQMGTDMAADIERDSFGHFDSSAEAFRHWDEDGEVSASCSKCHTAEGLPFFLDHGVTIAFEPSSSFSCETCHNDFDEYTLYPVESVEFPSGAQLAFDEESPNNMCLSCHQGRESTVSVNAAIARAGVGPDEISDELNFRNPHYYASGATVFGAEAMGAYQYEDAAYNGQFEHVRRFDECSDCHEQHAAFIRFDECTECHENVAAPEDVRLIRAEGEDEDGDPLDAVDYDGDGDTAEPIAAEIETLHNDLFAQIQGYAADTLGTPIAWAPDSYPYWYIDTNANGEADADEVNRDNRYASWSPTLLRAIYNFQYVGADPGSYAHNPDYILQVLYDSLADIGGEEAVASYTRPPVRESED